MKRRVVTYCVLHKSPPNSLYKNPCRSSSTPENPQENQSWTSTFALKWRTRWTCLSTTSSRTTRKATAPMAISGSEAKKVVQDRIVGFGDPSQFGRRRTLLYLWDRFFFFFFSIHFRLRWVSTLFGCWENPGKCNCIYLFACSVGFVLLIQFFSRLIFSRNKGESDLVIMHCFRFCLSWIYVCFMQLQYPMLQQEMAMSKWFEAGEFKLYISNLDYDVSNQDIQVLYFAFDFFFSFLVDLFRWTIDKEDFSC